MKRDFLINVFEIDVFSFNFLYRKIFNDFSKNLNAFNFTKITLAIFFSSFA